jgi:hypothetical protein
MLFPIKRAFQPIDRRQDAASRLVYSEDDLRLALTDAYNANGSRFTITIAADLALTAPVTVASSDDSFNIVIDGGGRKVYPATGGSVTYCFYLRSPSNVQLRNCVFKESASTTEFIRVEAGARAEVSGCTFHTSGHTYVLHVDGDQSKTTIRDIQVIEDSGSLTAIVGPSTAKNFTLSGLRHSGSSTVTNVATTAYATTTIGGYSSADGSGTSTGSALGFSVGNPNPTTRQAFEQTYVGNVTTTDSSAATLVTIPTSSGATYYVEADVSGNLSNGGSTGAYKVATRCRNQSGVLTVSTPTAVFTSEDVAGWNATIDGSGTDIRVRVTGSVSSTVVWQGMVKVRRI